VNGRRWLGLALIADLLGATVTLISVGRSWQRAVVTRQAPLTDAVLHLSGRDLEPAISGFGFIALAGVVALAASRGFGRRLIGAALVISGVVIIWFTAQAMTPVSTSQARASVPSGVGVDASSTAKVNLILSWPVLSLFGGLVVVIAGLLAVVFAGRWSEMAARYDAPSSPSRTEQTADTTRGDLSLWTALDRGDDPTARTEP
jgi:uncharacterized membrane protein (TIGR02234 family)